MEDSDRAGLRHRMEELEAFMEDAGTELTDYDEGMVKKLIGKITVYDDHITFEFKAGIETEVQL